MITFTAYAETYYADDEQECSDAEVEHFGALVGLRDAIDFLRVTGAGVSCVQPSDSEWSHARWVTAYGSMDYIDGTTENRSIHFPERMTASSRARVCRAIAHNI